jgi:hypothetical protein
MFEKKHIFFFKSKSFKYAAFDDYFWSFVHEQKHVPISCCYYYYLILLLIIFMNKIV